MQRVYQTVVDNHINRKLRTRPRLVIGIDGCGDSGKTRLASELLDAHHRA